MTLLTKGKQIFKDSQNQADLSFYSYSEVFFVYFNAFVVNSRVTFVTFVSFMWRCYRFTTCFTIKLDNYNEGVGLTTIKQKNNKDIGYPGVWGKKNR